MEATGARDLQGEQCGTESTECKDYRVGFKDLVGLRVEVGVQGPQGRVQKPCRIESRSGRTRMESVG